MGSSSHQVRDSSIVTSPSSLRPLDMDHEATSADHRGSIGPPIMHQEAPFSSPKIPSTTMSLDEAREYSPQRSRSLLALSSQGTSFLHRVFSGKSEPHPSEHTPPVSIDTERPMLKLPISEGSFSPMPKLPLLHFRSAAFSSASSVVYQSILGRKGCFANKFFTDLFMVPGFNLKDFLDSLHAYFDFPGLCHPFIPEEPFWQDFKAVRCSPALILAIACRGLPFTAATDKWEKQQLLAISCVKELMRARTSGAATETMRLDDLEAMALIIDFKYDGRHAGFKRCWKAFMTLDALVLMTLQSRNRLMNSDPSATLAHVDERFELLYWHVYSLDSFKCLDCKSISLIPNDALDLAKDPGYLAEGYLDAILSLAILARRINQELCNATARGKGIEYRDAEMLYEQLAHWRTSILPADLQRPVDRRAESPAEYRAVRESTPIPSSRLVPVRRAILWALELNCYLQIDDCVAQYGFKDRASIRAQAMAHLVGYQSHRAALEAVDLANVIRRCRPGNQEAKDAEDRPLVDIAPSVLRDICASACGWVCLHDEDPSKLQVSHTSANVKLEIPAQASGDETKRRRADLAEMGKTLRDTVAAASSHGDTEKLVKRLDSQLAIFQEGQSMMS
ncbi:uncharacterized protein N7511_004266 [Penicillium nucicola]|uniref:uncharacterized protein n=1 Tax=Penicillium nucicola TaxID=1850975 RepID=UPI0025455624|nr:uncharacterized protein N7511_004266 [Penicillium nucicola]KAJ5766650.1 hypothetical protein N7511_004266 [Penicillium nucicola]